MQNYKYLNFHAKMMAVKLLKQNNEWLNNDLKE